MLNKEKTLARKCRGFFFLIKNFEISNSDQKTDIADIILVEEVFLTWISVVTKL